MWGGRPPPRGTLWSRSFSHLGSGRKEPKPRAAASNSDMHIRMAILILSVGIAQAQSGVPTFQVPSSGDRPLQLVPGMLVSIYGTDLGPPAGRDPCHRSKPAFPAQVAGADRRWRALETWALRIGLGRFLPIESGSPCGCAYLN